MICGDLKAEPQTSVKIPNLTSGPDSRATRKDIKFSCVEMIYFCQDSSENIGNVRGGVSYEELS